MTGRSFVPAAEAARDVLWRAAGARLTTRQYRVLCAVVSLTALWSRTSDRVYLAQLAAAAHGVEEAKPWMLKKTRETLNELAALGLIGHQAPKGRPNVASGSPRYEIWLPPAPAKSDPAAGVSSDEKVTPLPDRKGPRPRTENDPAPGPPTGDYSGDYSDDQLQQLRLEWRERIREYEQESGRRAGGRLRDLIWNQVLVDAELDASPNTTTPDTGQPVRTIEAARTYGSRWAAVGISDVEFADCLKQQPDWQQQPDVLEAAWAAFHAYAKEAG